MIKVLETPEQLTEIIESSGVPVIVDFYAEWCGQCKIMDNALNEVDNTYEDEIVIVKIDTDKFPDIAKDAGVMSLPTLKFFYNKQEKDETHGVIPPSVICNKIKEMLK